MFWCVDDAEIWVLSVVDSLSTFLCIDGLGRWDLHRGVKQQKSDMLDMW